MSKKSVKKDVVRFFRGLSGKWRWRLISAKNGKILCNPGEDFSSKSKAIKNYERVRGSLASAKVEFEE